MTDEKRLTKEERDAVHHGPLGRIVDHRTHRLVVRLLDECDALEADLLRQRLRVTNAESFARAMMAERDEARLRLENLGWHQENVNKVVHDSLRFERDRDEARTTARELRDKHEPGTRLAWEDPEPPETLDDIAKLIEQDEHECGRAPFEEDCHE